MVSPSSREPDGTAGRKPPTHPFQIGAFRAYLMVRLSTILASNGMALIIAWEAYNIARQTMSPGQSAAQLGLIGLIQFVMVFVLTPFAGLVADNYSRTRIAMGTLSLLLFSAGILALSSYEGWISLPLIFALAALIGFARAFQGPALGSLGPNIVPKDLLPRAIAFSSMFWQAGSIVGPAVAGYAYAFKPYFAYMFSSALFGMAVIGMIFVGKVPQAARQRDRHPIGQIIDGLTYVRTNRLVFGAITLDLFAVLLAGTTALLPVYARDVLHIGSQGLGHLAAAPGIGAGLTALFFSFRPLRHNVGLKMMLSVGIFGLATIVFGLTAFMPQQTAIIVALFAMATWGSADMFSVFVRQSLIQLHTPDDMRGRVTSVSMMTISASNELGDAESGFLAALIGPIAAVIAGGVGAIAITLWWSRLFPELRNARTFDPPEVHFRPSHAGAAPAKEG
ncbi:MULTISPECIES: MFS transporter [unclassified Sphingobium]|uniref:MFS transporter n=1 Tax=unclassified Sphingobium TaxID=2611147 RepID=UPI0022254933|nr:MULTISPECIES: MFS transporter [unclassified Sphingobium]MCW2393862.1 MFS family permease [Sphingobium sp. B8D3B]MCW2417376.1 MFS family permease [Sphingobium sp. B8D3C]